MRPLALTALLAAAGVAAADPVTYLAIDEATGGAVAVIVPNVPLVHTGQFMGAPGPDRTNPRTAAEQADRVLEAVLVAVEAAGGDTGRLVRLNVGLTTADAAGPVREAIGRRIPADRRPAVTFVVGGLPTDGALVAMDAVAPAGPVERVRRVGGLRSAVPVGGSAAVVLPAGRRVYVSGQAEPGGTPAEATRRTLAKLRATLTWLGLTDADVVQCRAFLTPMSAAPDVVKEFDAHFGAGGPAIAFVEWKSTTPIEIELITAAPGAAAAAGPVEYLTPPGLAASPIFSRVTRVASDRFIYTAGLAASRPGAGPTQVAGTFDRLRAVLGEAGGDLNHLVKATYYVADEDGGGALNRLRPRYYDPKRPPAASKAMVLGVGVPARSLTIDMIAVPAAK
jgi:enamine deaminase RidA (YjgF/YER057c/UK114 family)